MKWIVVFSLLLTPISNLFGAPKGLNIGKDTTICSGSCITLHSNIAGKCKWSTGDTASTITVCPRNNTSVILLVTSGLKMYIDTINITVDKYCVWPGDANESGLVDKKDVLYIGRAYGAKGTPRADTSSAWSPVHADDWKKTFKNGLNYKYADCNGDGVIDTNDLKVIHINWSNTHKKMDTISVPGSSLYMVPEPDSAGPGQMVTYHIYLGSQSKPVPNIFGVGFSFQFSPGTVKPGSMNLSVNQNNCWLYGSDGPGAVISFQQPDYSNEIANVAISRTSLAGTLPGYGKIGDLSIYLPDNVVGKKDVFGLKNSNFIDAEAMAADESDIPLSPSGSSFYFTDHTLGISQALKTDDAIALYPNPVTGNILNINLAGTSLKAMVVTDMLGNTVYNSNTELTGNVQVQLPDLKQGIYIVRLSTDKGITIRKINILHN